MNTPNPLVPQGTTPAGGKSTVRNAVLTIVVVHVAFIGSLLFWGCSKDTTAKKDDSAVSSLNSTDTNVYPVESNSASAVTGGPSGIGSVASAVPSGSVAVPPITSNTAVTPLPTATSSVPLTSPAAVTPTPVTALTPTAPAVVTPGSDYAVAKGDTLAGIAKNHHVTLKALQEANPGVDSKKLKVGQKIQIPSAVAASATPAASATGAAAGPADATSGTESASYTVKAGDSLARIAKNHHTTIKSIVALNGLKSQNNLKVGQKLKMPAPKAAAAAASADPGPSASAAGASAVTPLSPAPHTATAIN